MPGTPATSPRVGAPRYANTDASDFAGQTNAVTDAFDAKVGIFLSGVASARPAAGIAERYYYATDTGELTRDTGTAWTGPLNPRSTATVTSLPGSPYDGQIIDYLADATLGILWRFRYRAASASAYKWEYLGGTAMFAEVTPEESTASTTYVALATTGPNLTVPLAGDYWVEVGARALGGVNLQMYMSYAIGATAAADADAYFVTASTTSQSSTGSRVRQKTGLAAAATLAARYRTTTGTATWSNRWMRVAPIRVG